MKTKRAEKLARMERALDALIRDAHSMEERHRSELEGLHPDQLLSARNLLHYLALRSHDLSELQEELGAAGLSSLGRCGAHVLATLHAVRHAVQALQGRAGTRSKGPVTFKRGPKLIKRRTRALLGRKVKGSAARIMVTLPAEAADDPQLVRDLVEAGMNCARINCAQGGPAEWARMLSHLERARRATGRGCRAFMDVTGPKIRTGPLVPGPRVLAIRPRKDLRGNVVEPRSLVLVPEGEGPFQPLGEEEEGDPVVPITPALFRALQPGVRLGFTDTRGRPGHFEVVGVSRTQARAVCPSSAYLETGLTLTLEAVGTHGGPAPAAGAVGTLPSRDDPIVLRPGDTLILHAEARPGEPARAACGEHPLVPAHVACTPGAVLADVRAGEGVVLDDGKARGIVREVREGEVVVEITGAPRGGMKLRGHKGIHFPDSCLRLPGLTERDREDLRFIAAHADGATVSFVNRPENVQEALREMEGSGRADLGLILKIETREGLRNLPAILLAAMARPAVGVMIARGDLAVATGWVDLARVQEEILSVCEAAHVPVVWATEVLDRLAKTGTPTRSEISDVVMAERAECVMLNKGPYIVEAIHTLEAVLRSVQSFQRKKTTLLPPLALDTIRTEPQATPAPAEARPSCCI